MLSVITKSVENSYSYDAYRAMVSSLLKEGKSSGNEQSEALTHYSQLNEVRMNRLDKTISITSETINKLKHLQGDYIWLVLAEGWCGDAAQILPVIHKMADLSEKIDLRIVFRDENDDLMNQFLTNNTKSIPKLIVLDKHTLEVLADYGPRPEGAKQLMLDYKAEHGSIDDNAKTNLQLWYLHDKGFSIQTEIVDLMAALEKHII